MMRKILSILLLTIPFVILCFEDMWARTVYIEDCGPATAADCPPSPTAVTGSPKGVVCCCDRKKCYFGEDLTYEIAKPYNYCKGKGVRNYTCGAGKKAVMCVYSIRQCPSNKVCVDEDGCSATCPEGMYREDQGFGFKEYECTDDCGAVLLDYCYCPDCSQSCPAPLLDVPRYPTPPAQNLALTNFRNCVNDCGIPSQGSCYEDPSPQPTEQLEIFPVDTNRYGFRSTTHTGIPKGIDVGTLNDPVSMEARYTDINGVDDIEALGVWFRDQVFTGEIETPVRLSTSLSPQTASTDSWGFLLRRENDIWNPYVPSYQNSENPGWVAARLITSRIGNSDSISFYIPSPEGGNMVEVNIGSITEDSSTNTIRMRYTLKFDSAGLHTRVKETSYNVYLMGLDIFSFTPHDNYSAYSAEVIEKIQTIYWPDPNQLRFRLDPPPAQRYARDWSDVGDWTVDKTDPSATIKVEVLEPGGTGDRRWLNIPHLLRVSFETRDNQGLYAVIGNIYYSDMGTPLPVEFKDVSSGIEVAGGIFTPPSVDNIEVMGHLVQDRAFWVTDIPGNAYNGTLIVDTMGNNEGKLHFVLTVYDDAGNMSPASQYEIDLNDWFATTGGLAYSKEGTSFVAKETSTDWSGILPPFSSTVLTSSKGDFSTEMWANDSKMLIKSGIVDSYAINGHKGYGDMSYYDVFSTQIQKKKSEDTGIFVKEISGSSISTPVSGEGLCAEGAEKEYCVLMSSGDLDINQGMVCDKKVAIFVNGNLSINSSFGNTPDSVVPSDTNGCIFVVKGAMNINQGEKKSTSTSLGYDVLNGYFLVDGIATVYPDSFPIFDGVYINGGLHSQSGIEIMRSLRLVERLHYPVLAIEHHSKYGVIAERLFNSAVIVQKVEVGVKPF